MESRTERLTTGTGLHIVYERTGTGPPIMLLHGFIVDRRTWQPQLEDLHRDFDVIAWDAPGTGESSNPPEEFSMAQFADCLAATMDHAGISSAHLVGLSWGGTLSIEFWRKCPSRVRSLVLADTYAGWTGSLGPDAAAERLARCLRESQLPAEQWVPQWVPGAFSDAAPKELLDEFAAIMSDFHPVGFRAMSRAVAPDFSQTLAQIRAPTLLVWGDDDKRAPLSSAEPMREKIAGSRLTVIPNAGHLSNLEQPERFNAIVQEFINRVEHE